MEKQDKKKGPGAVETLFATAGKFVATVCSAIVGFIKGLVKKNPKLAIPLLIAAAVILVGVAAICTENVVTTNTKMAALGFRDIGELATQSSYFTGVHAMEKDKDLWGWKVPFTHSEWVISYDGVIKVGFDFEKVEVEVNDITKTVKVRFPEAILIAHVIDPDSLEVYDQDRNIFTPFAIEDFGNAMMELKDESIVQAYENGIFDEARENGEVVMKTFLSSLYNPNEYTFEFEHAKISEAEQNAMAEFVDQQTTSADEIAEQ